MIQTYVEFVYSGIIVSEKSSEKVQDRSKPKLPKAAVGYSFFDREERTIDGETLVGSPKNHSHMTYIGKEFTAEEYMNEPTCNEIARSNIKGNGYKRLVLLKNGQLYPLDEKDVVVSE